MSGQDTAATEGSPRVEEPTETVYFCELCGAYRGEQHEIREHIVQNHGFDARLNGLMESGPDPDATPEESE